MWTVSWWCTIPRRYLVLRLTSYSICGARISRPGEARPRLDRRGTCTSATSSTASSGAGLAVSPLLSGVRGRRSECACSIPFHSLGSCRKELRRPVDFDFLLFFGHLWKRGQRQHVLAGFLRL